jgi:hypothetical protein
MKRIDPESSRMALHRHRKRTGIGLADLLAGRDDAPAGFEFERMERLYRTGTGDIEREHLNYVIALWSALPDRYHQVVTGRAREAASRESVDLTPEIQAELRGHWLRVGLSVEAFFRRLENPPSRLKSSTILRWLSDYAPRRVRTDHLESVIAAWEKLPDGLGRPKRIHFIPFEATDR